MSGDESAAEGRTEVFEGGGPGEWRLFTAVALPEDVAKKAGELIERLRRGAGFTGAHPAWVKHHAVHLTLVFLGNVATDSVPGIKDAMDAAVVGAGALRLDLNGLHLFPTPKEPRVISLGVSGQIRELEALRERLASQLRERGLEVESRPFRPHLTLARIKSTRGVPGLRSLVASHSKLGPGPMLADRITLFRSHLGADGSRYEVIHEAELAVS